MQGLMQHHPLRIIDILTFAAEAFPLTAKGKVSKLTLRLSFGDCVLPDERPA